MERNTDHKYVHTHSKEIQCWSVIQKMKYLPLSNSFSTVSLSPCSSALFNTDTSSSPTGATACTFWWRWAKEWEWQKHHTNHFKRVKRNKGKLIHHITTLKQMEQLALASQCDFKQGSIFVLSNLCTIIQISYSKYCTVSAVCWFLYYCILNSFIGATIFSFYLYIIFLHNKPS